MQRRAAGAAMAQKAGQGQDSGSISQFDATRHIANPFIAIKFQVLPGIDKAFQAQLLQKAQRPADPQSRHLILCHTKRSTKPGPCGFFAAECVELFPDVQQKKRQCGGQTCGNLIHSARQTAHRRHQ